MNRPTISRRSFFSVVGASAAATMAAGMGLAPAAAAAAASSQTPATAGFSLPPLPYAYDALEPFIDTQTMLLHHTKHHGAAVTNLNNALKDRPELLRRSVTDLLANIRELPAALQTPVRNAGGAHLNHSIFWATMGPGGGGEPVGALAKQVAATFGNFATLRTHMSDAALRVFGSGWTWLVLDRRGTLQVVNRPNQDSPVMDGLAVLTGIDMFEHAYYLKYQNRRNEYVAAFWNVINWESVALRYEQARSELA